MKKIKILIVSLILFGLLSLPALAISDEYPVNAPVAGGVYIQANVTLLGDVLIYVPVEYKSGFFSFLSGTENVINMGNSTINCNMYSGANYTIYYQARFTRFGTLEYYYNYQGNNYRWDPLTVNTVYNTNVVIVDNQSSNAIRQVPLSAVIDILILFFLMIISLILLIKRN